MLMLATATVSNIKDDMARDQYSVLRHLESRFHVFGTLQQWRDERGAGIKRGEALHDLRHLPAIGTARENGRGCVGTSSAGAGG